MSQIKLSLLVVSFLVCGLMEAAPKGRPLPARVRDIDEAAFRGRLYLPASGIQKENVAVLFIGGSEGHLSLADEVAPQLAASGFSVLGIDYHDGFSGPRPLANIPIEMFQSAVTWMHHSPELSGSFIVAIVDSRGSEAALLTAAYDREISAVVAVVPSSIVWGSTGRYAPSGASGWSWQGKPLPFLNADPKRIGASAFEARLEGLPDDSPTRIPVERIHGPILLLGSDADGIWPSGAMCRSLASRLEKAHYDYPVTIVTASQSSHRLLGTGPSSPRETYTYPGGSYTADFGGTAAGTEQARNIGWATIVAFLKSIRP